MTGAIMQLRARGVQDEQLTFKPEKNFFTKVYQRYTNFSIENIQLSFKENVNWGKKLSVMIPRKGDFIGRMYLCFELPKLEPVTGTYVGWVDSIGHRLIDNVELEIGGQIVCKLYGLYMAIWRELTTRDLFSGNEGNMVGKYLIPSAARYTAVNNSKYVVSLPFWFCEDISRAFPMISLYHHQVKLIFQFKNFSECITYDGNVPPNQIPIVDAYLDTEYIFMDDTERLKWEKMEHNLLIEQIQIRDPDQATGTGVFNAPLQFNHPCKEMLWVFVEKDSEDNNDWLNFAQRTSGYLTDISPIMTRGKLILDGNERFTLQDEKVYRQTYTNRFHTCTTDKHIYVISFCDKPEEFQPSGSLNFSRFSDTSLYCELAKDIASPVKLYIFARNYNWLNIKDGLCRLNFQS